MTQPQHCDLLKQARARYSQRELAIQHRWRIQEKCPWPSAWV